MLYSSTLSEYREFGLFVALAAVWGTSFLAIEVGLETIPPVTFAALRYDIAGILLLGYAGVVAFRSDKRWRPRGRDEWQLVGVGGFLLIGVHFALLFAGQRYVTGGIASVIMSLTPVLTPLFALVLLPDERLDKTGVVGVVLGLLGVVVVAQPDGSGGQALLGILLLLLSAASFALGSVLTRKFDTDLSVVPMQAWMMLVGAGVLHAMVAVLPGESVAAATFTPEAVVSMLYLAIAASIGGLLAYFHLLEQVGPNEVTLVNYAVPMFAAGSELVAFGYGISTATAIGFLVILAGFVAVKWRTVHRTAVPRPERRGSESQASNGGAVMVEGNAYYKDVE
ncbi:DMT family transporter [Halorussus halophilus]|uniref:DMT family transporter n=1 Tax=Halorussus halophilus TaxID=2650975 RepID=UPI001301041A|nr:DMT family transporter [Halorussus halophilus]